MSLSPPAPSASPPRPKRARRLTAGVAAVLAAASGITLATSHGPARADTAATTTAWGNGVFNLSPDGVVSRDDIVLGQPNISPIASIPLGNGSLAAAAWSANGFTAQFNRSDTMPARKSPGQVNIPGLSVITHAKDFSGRLDLTDGVLEESGGGMSMKAWISTRSDELIVDVKGANPNIAQTASVYLWPGRNPTAAANGTMGTLAETWKDNSGFGASGQTFGTLSTITAGGRNVQASVVSPTKVQVSFLPNADGDFRVVAAVPSWTGGTATDTPVVTAASVIGNDVQLPEQALMGQQNSWWNRFWTHSGLVQMNSADGSAAYIENLRTLYLYDEAASQKPGVYPGSQAGEADMFAWSEDRQTWNPNDYWIWNLRAEISANMSSGNYQLNTPIFDMYINDLPAIEAWTRAQMGGLPGACVPETMSFNGNGYYGDGPAPANASCAFAAAPQWNAEDITSGPEMSLYMWEQYLATDNLPFLKKAFPFMEATAQFLLAYQQAGADGLLHAIANAHETQWSVRDPTTDITADQTLFPIIAKVAALVGDKPSGDPLLAEFTAVLAQIPPYPRTDEATKTQLLNPDYTAAETQAADATGTDMIAISYQPTARRQNGENIELEPLWPWDQVNDQDAGLWALEQRSYTNRPNKGGNDWSFDAVDAARLEQPAQVASNLVSLTESHQVYPNGFADIGSSVGYQPYLEQSATVATAVDEALAQDYDGTIRFAPAWPSSWDASGTVYIQHNDKVDVQVENGQLATAAIEAGTSGTLRVKNPWPGQQVQVVTGDGQSVVVPATAADIVTVPVQEGQSYLVEQASAPTAALPFAPVTGTAPTSDRHLGKVQVGLDPEGPATTAVVGTVLGSSNNSYGLTQADYSGTDEAGTTTASDVDGLSARTTSGSAAENDMYFGIDPAVAATSSYAATITASYYDSGTGTVALQYDNGFGDPYHTAGTIALTGSDTWKTATFKVTDAYFGGLQNAGADFRLDGQQPITVHSVGVTVTGPVVPSQTEFPPAPSITTPKGGQTLPLAGSISGTAEPGGTVTVNEGPTTLCTATASDSGAWSCAPPGGLTPGRQTISATVSDPTGLTGAASSSVSFDASDLPPGTAVVASIVGPTNYAYGMTEDEVPSAGFDGPTAASDIGGLSARTSTDSNIYFNIDDSIAFAGDYSATFKVVYYDQGTGSFQVQYDDGSSDPYRAATPNIPLTNTDTWKTATVTAADAYFGGKQHSAADFRLRNGSGQVTVHSVVVTISGDGVPNVTDFPPPVAITVPVAGAHSLTATAADLTSPAVTSPPVERQVTVSASAVRIESISPGKRVSRSSLRTHM